MPRPDDPDDPIAPAAPTAAAPAAPAAALAAPAAPEPADPAAAPAAPEPADPTAALAARLTTDRAALIRAAVVDPALADAVTAAALTHLTAPAPQRAAALQALRALAARGAVPALIAALRAHPADWLAIPDPENPPRTLAQTALHLALTLAGPHRLTDTLRWALTIPELAPDAWHALGADDPDAVLPHLAALLTAAPALAPAVATRFALVHTPRCEDACRALAPLPEATRRAFAATLEKHLRRVAAIRRWITCRRLLFGR